MADIPTLDEDLLELLERFESEMTYNAAKGTNPYRQGMHDGLFFGRDQLALVLRMHAIARAAPPEKVSAAQAAVAPPRQYGL